MLHAPLARALSLAALAAPLWSVSAQIEPDSTPDSLGPLGGSAIEIAVNPADDDEILVISYLQGVRRSTDGGATFVSYGVGLPGDAQELTHDPTDPQGLFARSGNTFYSSSDFGANWSGTVLPTTETLKSIAVPGSGDDILVTDPFNTHLSTDGGATWTTVASLVPFAGEVFGPVAYSDDGTHAYIGTGNGVWTSTDGGATWTPPGVFNEWVQALVVDPADSDHIFVGTPFDGVFESTDGGVSFTAVNGGAATSGNSEWFRWGPTGRIWYATLNTLGYSDDGGTSWTLATGGWPQNTPIPSTMTFDSTGRRYLGCEGGGLHDQSGGGLYRMDSGAPGNWVHIGFLVSRINDVAVAGPGGLRITGIGSGVYAGVPGVPPTPTAWVADIGTDTRTIAIDPDDPTRWVTGGVGAFQDNAQIVVLTNSGANFAKTYEVFGAGIVTDVEFNPHDTDVLVAGCYPGGFGNESIVRSTDGGNTWTDIPGTAGWATVAVAFDPVNAGHVIQLSENNQWSRSLDGGASWTGLQPAWPASGAAVMLEFDPFTDGRVFRADTGSFWRSDDYGTNWSLLAPTAAEGSDIEFHATQPDLFWYSDGLGNVLVSDDGGDSFQLALDVPLDSNASALALDPLDGTLIVGTWEASAWQVEGASPVIDLGPGTEGTGGFTPRFTLGGGLPQLGNANFSLHGEDILGGALIYLALSFSHAPQPAFGGTFHPEDPIWRFYLASGTPFVGGDGAFSANFPLPVDPVLLGLTIHAQFAIPDGGTPHPSQVALSNAMRFTFHN